jgi:anti-sigma factor RsiW
MTGSIANATSPQERDLLLHAYLDDELDVANALVVKQQIEADPALKSELAGAMALQKVLMLWLPKIISERSSDAISTRSECQRRRRS